MSNSTLRKLAIAMFILIAVWFLQQQWNNRQLTSNSAMAQFNPDGGSADVRQIQIDDGQKPLTMIQKDGIWFLKDEKPLGENRAVQDDAKKLIQILDGIPVELVSQNETKHESLGISDAKAIKLTFYKDDTGQAPITTLLVAKDNKSLVRIKDKVNVYKWSNDYSTLIKTDISSWTEPTPMPTPTTSQEATPSAK